MRYYTVIIFLTYYLVGQDCSAIDGTSGVELWGKCYSIKNTKSLNLYNNSLEGPIDPQIGELVNLNFLSLCKK